MDIREVKYYLEEYAKTVVGVVLKRLELLTDKDLNLTSEQIHSLYKKLLKENVYEQLRAFKKLIGNVQTDEKIIFNRPKE